MNENNLSIKRLEALSDGIFAIAMTILVLNISIPDKETVKQIGLHNALWEQGQEFYSYFLSFFLLSIFWIIQHKQMNLLIKTNHTHVWITIWLLMFICLIPFSASMLSDYGNNRIASTIFCGNMLIVGLIFLQSWLYSIKNNRLIPKDYDRGKIKKGTRNILIFISISATAVLVSVVAPSYSGMTFLLIPVLKSFNR
ncbi:TMEM175 family protein [Bacteroidota bacterium]